MNVSNSKRNKKKKREEEEEYVVMTMFLYLFIFAYCCFFSRKTEMIRNYIHLHICYQINVIIGNSDEIWIEIV